MQKQSYISISKKIEMKIEAFEYVLDKLIEWKTELHSELSNEEVLKSFSKLSVLKLLFFVASIRKKQDDKYSDLLHIFNAFYALPYGPVESDIYDSILLDRIPRYTIGDSSLIIKKEGKSSLDSKDKKNIDVSISALRNINKSLIDLKPYELVEITHKWDCWKNTYQYALFLGKMGYSISVNQIRSESNRVFY